MTPIRKEFQRQVGDTQRNRLFGPRRLFWRRQREDLPRRTGRNAERGESFSTEGSAFLRVLSGKHLSCCALIVLTTWASSALNAGEKPIASDQDTPLAATATSWPLFRGDAKATGVSPGNLPDKLDVVWKKEFEQGGFDATAVIVDGVVYIGGANGDFYALELGTGREIWKHHTESAFSASAAVRNGKLYVGDADGKFYCMNAADGKTLWEHSAGAEINSSANFYRGLVLYGSQDATLYALQADTGAEAWKFTIQDQIRCSPTVVENRAFIAGCDGKLHVVDLDTGMAAEGVKIDGPTGATPAVLGDMVYFGSEGGTFYAINWKQAEIVWSGHEQRTQPLRSSAAVIDGLVVYGGRDKLLHAVAPGDGHKLWSFAAKGRIDSSPVIVGARVFVGAADGRLYAFDRRSGEKLWQYEAGGDFAASPAVANGRLVIGTTQGALYCFGAKSP